MSPVGAVTVAAAAASFAAFVWTVYQLLDIGFDSHAAGPLRRPEPARRPTRLPADFVGLWSLFGQRSMRYYAGSWEAAVSRLDRLEASLREAQPTTPVASSQSAAGQAMERHATPVAPQPAQPVRSRRRAADPAEEWLHRRLDHLEALAGLTRPVDHKQQNDKQQNSLPPV
jgi:hypothetical protein